MAAFVEYQLDDGSTVLVKLPEEDSRGGLVRAGREDSEPVIIRAQSRFTEAFESIRKVSCAIKDQLEDLRADEVTVKFGLVSTGKLGNFAVGEVGVAANYEITLKWNNAKKPEKPPARMIRRFRTGQRLR